MCRSRKAAVTDDRWLRQERCQSEHQATAGHQSESRFRSARLERQRSIPTEDLVDTRRPHVGGSGSFSRQCVGDVEIQIDGAASFAEGALVQTGAGSIGSPPEASRSLRAVSTRSPSYVPTPKMVTFRSEAVDRRCSCSAVT